MTVPLRFVSLYDVSGGLRGTAIDVRKARESTFEGELRLQSDFGLSPMIRSGATRNQWRGSMELRIPGFHWPAPLVSQQQQLIEALDRVRKLIGSSVV